MIPPIIAAAGIVGAADLIGNAVGNATTNSANRKLAEYSYQKDLEQWNRANEYNSPVKQMERLSQAGLNPNLVYGGGSSTGNTTTATSPRYNPPTIDRRVPSAGSRGLGDYVNMQNAQQNMLKTQAQIPLIQAETNRTLAQAVTEAMRPKQIGADILNTDSKTALNEFTLSRSQKLEPYQLESARLGNIQTERKIANMVLDGKLTIQQIENMAQALINAKKDLEIKGHISEYKRQENLYQSHGVDKGPFQWLRPFFSFANNKDETAPGEHKSFSQFLRERINR